MYCRHNCQARSSFDVPSRSHAAPEQRVLPGERRCHHSLTDRLEDFRLAEIGNQETERHAGCGIRLLREGTEPARRSTSPAA